MTAKLLLPGQDRGLIDARRHEKQHEAELDLLVGRRKTPGAHTVKHGGGETLVGDAPQWEKQVRNLPPRRDCKTDIQTPHKARILFAFLLIDFLKLRQKGKNLLL